MHVHDFPMLASVLSWFKLTEWYATFSQSNLLRTQYSGNMIEYYIS